MKTMRETLHLVAHEATTTTELLIDMVRSNRHGRRVGIPSVCSANRFVLEAALAQAARDETVALIESTCNQVNQFGGYTGMTPADFMGFVAGIAAAQDFPRRAVIVGGDHLGPYPWRAEPAGTAMAKARGLVRHCVLAGYLKIHLDCSMRLADDPGAENDPLDDETATARTAELAAVAEAARAEMGTDAPAPVYVIGTEVPVPGGEQAEQAGPVPTTTAHVERTIGLARDAFAAAGLDAAWERVIGLVVQPGVEFGDEVVYDFDPAAARDLAQLVGELPHLVYEAHSTDYQTAAALRALVEAHFAILKVGPALTFALREAIFGLAAIETELYGDAATGAWPGDAATGATPGDAATGATPGGAPAGGEIPSRLRQVLNETMLRHPEHWRPYYSGDERALRVARDFSYSDRVRYYWPRPELGDALERLLANLAERPIPPTLLSQYLPDQYRAWRAGELGDRPEPADLIRHAVLVALDPYAAACGMR